MGRGKETKGQVGKIEEWNDEEIGQREVTKNEWQR